MDQNWMPKNYQPDLVSVIVPTYNRATLLLQTLDSVWNQTYRFIELLIIDDGSTDDTEKVVNIWRQSHATDTLFTVNYFKQLNKGSSAARNLGLAKSHGQFIQFLDSDDLLGKWKIERQVACCKSLQSTVFGDCYRFTVGPKDILLYPMVARNNPKNALGDWFEGRFVASMAFLWRREDIIKNGPWNEKMSLGDDGEFACRFLLSLGTWLFCENTISYYRVYQDMRAQVSRSATYEALQQQLNSLIQTEQKLVQLGWFLGLKTSIAKCYWVLARQSAFVPDIKKQALAHYRRIDPAAKLPERLSDRILYRLFGIAGRRRLVNMVRSVFNINTFKPQGHAPSIEDLCNLDPKDLKKI